MIEGFVYVPGDHRLRAAAVGDVVVNATRGAPWMVVDHQLASVIVTTWPGRLLAVEVTDAVDEVDLAAARQPGLRPDAGYTRAVGVRVLDELAPSRLFGAHGAAVVEVIERAQRLSIEDAAVLAAADDPDAPGAYTAAWNAWLVAEERTTTIPGEGHDGTLAIPARGRAGAPIHGGFLVISSELRKHAIAVCGDAATVVDEEGERSLALPWSRALRALLHAAMALGAPELVPPADRARLLSAWDALTLRS